MPHLDNDRRTGQNLAVLAEALYIANLLLIPVIGFAILCYLFLTQYKQAPPLARSHLEQTLSASLWIAVLFTVFAAGILLLKNFGMEAVSMWIIIILVFTMLHASMVLLGVLGLAKAMAGKCWRYPLVGKTLPDNCSRYDKV